MTNTTSQTEQHVERPEELARLDADIETQKNRLDQLNTLSQQVEKIYAEAAELDSAGRKIVAEEIPEIRRDLPAADTIEDLDRIQEQIADIVADPYRQAVRRARTDVLETLGIEKDFNDSVIEQLNSALEDRPVERLQEDTDALLHANDDLGSVTEAARATVATQVVNSPIATLTKPAKAFDPVVNQVVDRHDELVSVDDALAAVAWSPGMRLADTCALYGAEANADNGQAAIEYVENVESTVQMAPDDLPLAEVIQAHLEAAVASDRTVSLERLFATVNQAVDECTSDRDAYEQATTLADTLDGEDNLTAESVQIKATAVKSPVAEEVLTADSPLSVLHEKLDALVQAYEQWVTEYTTTLERDAVAIEAIQGTVDWAPAFTPPADGLSITDDQVDEKTVAENPVAALATHREYRTWVGDLRTQVPQEGSEAGLAMVDKLVKLVRGQNISTEEVDPTTYSDLATHLDGGLKLRFTGTAIEDEEDE